MSVAGVIEPALQAAEIRRSANKPTNDLTAYDLYLRALHTLSLSTREGVWDSLTLVENATTRDPAYGPAFAMGALCHFQLHLNGWAEAAEESRKQGVDYARRALRNAIDDPFVLASAGVTLGYFGEDIDAAIALVDRSLDANPSFAFGWFCSAILKLQAGQPEISIAHVKTSLRLNPRDRFGSPLSLMGGAYFLNREFEKAVVTLRTAIQERPGFSMAYRFLAACYVQTGRLDQAREIVDRLRAITPVVVPNTSFLRNPEHRELLLSGLRLAAVRKHEPDPPSCRDPRR